MTSWLALRASCPARTLRSHPREAAPGARVGGSVAPEDRRLAGSASSHCSGRDGPPPPRGHVLPFSSEAQEGSRILKSSGTYRSAVWGEGEHCHFLFLSFFFFPPSKRAACQKVSRVSSSAAPPWLYLRADMHYITRKSFKKYRQLDPSCRNLVCDLYKIREERTILGGRGVCLCSLRFFANFPPNRKPEKECPLCILAHGNQRPGSPPPSAVIELGKRSRLHKVPRSRSGVHRVSPDPPPSCNQITEKPAVVLVGDFPGLSAQKELPGAGGGGVIRSGSAATEGA